MKTRHDDLKHVTYYGDAPIRDHGGYGVDTSVQDGTNLLGLKVALDASMRKGIRADLNPTEVAELRDRCDAFLQDHQEPK
ncbi:hypothetical protein [Nocardia sp. NPDC049707]|uniref:hypothetical protein n=1 Tax=Nocardia sp. NPDC049707 TaxID=3154735 RepID=UPI0034280A89